MTPSIFDVYEMVEGVMRRAYGDEYVDAVKRGDYDDPPVSESKSEGESPSEP